MSEQQYLDLLEYVLTYGTKKTIFGHEDKYILSKFGALLRFDLSQGFPIITTKKTYYKGAFAELLWFIEGSGDVVKLHKQGVNIWDSWGCKYWNQNEDEKLILEQYQQAIDDGEILGHRIPLHYKNSTAWHYSIEYQGFGQEVFKLDQTKWVIDNIQKTPDRKSFLVSYWNPTEVYQMADECGNESVSLPACHTHYSVNVSEGKLSLMLYMRSWDLLLGAPFNIAQYALLTHMYAQCTGFDVGELVITAADHHIYSDHIEQVTEQISRQPLEFPTISIKQRGQKYLQDFVLEDFEINNYQYHKPIKAPITVVGGY
jgi:thymidylate synthase